MRPRRMRPFLVVMPSPDAADVNQVLFSHDDKLIQTLELERLDESLDVGPQIGRQWRVPFHNGSTGFQHFIELSAVYKRGGEKSCI